MTYIQYDSTISICQNTAIWQFEYKIKKARKAEKWYHCKIEPKIVSDSDFCNKPRLSRPCLLYFVYNKLNYYFFQPSSEEYYLYISKQPKILLRERYVNSCYVRLDRLELLPELDFWDSTPLCKLENTPEIVGARFLLGVFFVQTWHGTSFLQVTYVLKFVKTALIFSHMERRKPLVGFADGLTLYK